MECRGILVLAGSAAVWLGLGCRPAAPGHTPPAASLSSEERKARELASGFLAGRNTGWGDPARVSRETREFLPGLTGEGVYLVTYPTPADELKRLGDRAVVVDITTGRVGFVPRD